MSKYEQFIKQMKAKGASEPYMSREDFNIMEGIGDDRHAPIIIEPKQEEPQEPVHEKQGSLPMGDDDEIPF